MRVALHRASALALASSIFALCSAAGTTLGAQVASEPDSGLRTLVRSIVADSLGGVSIVPRAGKRGIDTIVVAADSGTADLLQRIGVPVDSSTMRPSMAAVNGALVRAHVGNFSARRRRVVGELSAR
jgi:hypothetical protein